MRKLIYAFLLLTLITACSPAVRNADQNIALIEGYIESVENLDYKTMEELLDDNYLGLGPYFGDSTNKEFALENWKYLVENLYESITYNRSRNVAVTISSGDNQGEWVSNWAELSIRYQNNENTVTIWANTIYQIQDGKIVKSFTFYNEADALRQLGYRFY